MIRYRLIETIGTTEQWQVEYCPVSTQAPVAIAWVSVEPGGGVYLSNAKLRGMLLGEGLAGDSSNIATMLIEKCKWRWIGLKHTIR